VTSSVEIFKVLTFDNKCDLVYQILLCIFLLARYENLLINSVNINYYKLFTY